MHFCIHQVLGQLKFTSAQEWKCLDTLSAQEQIKGSAKERHKFVHCLFPELGHQMDNVSVQHKARTDWSIFTKSKQPPNTQGADLGSVLWVLQHPPPPPKPRLRVEE